MNLGRNTITVIVVTYNSRCVLPAFLNSLEKNVSALDLEIIIADNGSEDTTVEWLETYAVTARHLFSGFYVLSLPYNRGYAYANNRAVEYAHGDTLLLVNPDTILESSTIDVCRQVLIRDNKVGAVGCRLVLPTGQLDRACKRSFPTLWNSFSRFTGMSYVFPKSRVFAGYNLTYLSEHNSYPVDCLSGAFLMIPRPVYEMVGGFDENFFMYGEDIDLCYRVKQFGYEIWYEGSTSTIHLKGGNGGKRTSKSLWEFYMAMYQYYLKRINFRRCRPLALLVWVVTRAMWILHTLINLMRST